MYFLEHLVILLLKPLLMFALYGDYDIRRCCYCDIQLCFSCVEGSSYQRSYNNGSLMNGFNTTALGDQVGYESLLKTLFGLLCIGHCCCPLCSTSFVSKTTLHKIVHYVLVEGEFVIEALENKVKQ